MYDPKFEKAVQDKMDQLEFTPSDAVWEKIKTAVGSKPRRRAVPVFWWLLVPSLLALGAGGALYLRKSSAAVAVNGGSAAVAVNGGSAAVAVNGGSAAVAVNGGSAAASDRAAKVGGQRHDGRSKVNADGGSKAYGDDRSKAYGDDRSKAYGEGGSPAENAAPAGIAEDRTGEIDGGGSRADVAGTAVTGVPGAPLTVPANRQPYRYWPGLIGSLASRSGIIAPPFPSRKVSTAVSGLPKPKRPWSAGFAGGVGVSSYNENLKTPTSPVMLVPNTQYTFTPSSLTMGAGQSSSKRTVSNVQTGLSYWAGVLANKPLSARWSFSLGLDLHYYSSSIHIGQEVASYVRNANALIGAAAVAPVQSYPYYAAGNEQVYTNRYYYLELPVAMEWRVNRSHVLPIFLRGGVTLSRLMSSNALYYDGQSGVYFKDDGVINRTQLSFASALMAGLPVRGLRVQAGPEIQYGMTALLKAGAGSGHLFYGGLRIAVMR